MGFLRRTVGVTLAAVAAALLGCGGDVTHPEASAAADIARRTLVRIKTLEEQLAKDEVNSTDLRTLIVSINYLLGHMKKEGIGTDRQRRALEDIREQLARSSPDPARPPRDWRPGKDKSPPTPTPAIDSGPLKELLPKLRSVIEGIK